ncbi:MAG: Gfo/Idh/MocA family protein [Armatimonadota bacterium]
MSDRSAEPVRIGVLGAGRRACGAFLPLLRQLPGARVVAVSSDNLENRDRAREAWGDPLCFYEEAEDLLLDELDAVVIATPSDTHERLSLAALAAGKHVYCEKPAAESLEGIERLLAAREAAGTVYQTGLELRCSAVARSALAALQSGELGSLRALEGVFSPRAALPLEWLDLVHLLTGETPRRAFAAPTSERPPRSLAIVLEYPQLTAELRTDAGQGPSLLVQGTAGSLHACFHTGTLALARDDAEPRELRVDLPPEASPGLRAALEAWLESIRTGAPPGADLHAARAAQATADALERSLRSGVPEPVRPSAEVAL